MEENWLTPNLRNALEQQKKKHLNKITRFEINPKSLSTGRDKGFDENFACSSK